MLRTLLLSTTLLSLHSDALAAPHVPLFVPQSPSAIRSARPSPRLWASANDASPIEKFRAATDSEVPSHPPNLQWVSIGLSTVYLAHFASLYTQLPGLFGRTGLLPLSPDRIADLDGLWALDYIPTPELGMEIFTALGIVISVAQIIFPQLRRGPAGVVSYGLQWLFWHDLVVAGGRFMEYQMDLLLLDAAPISILAASGLESSAATFGYRWLLSRLYLGAGAVKLLSCDTSWRDLSAVHWHLQSQPLPNSLGAAAFLHLPDSICQAITLAVLVVEMVAPYLFLARSLTIRRIAFCLNAILMAGIAAFGNFGPLQALLVVISFSLLDDLSPIEVNGYVRRQQSDEQVEKATTATDSISPIDGDLPSTTVSALSVVLAARAAFWTVSNVGARCIKTLDVEPLVYGLVALGAIVASLPIFSSGGVRTAVGSVVIFAGSASTMANGLGVPLPFNELFDMFNFGASPYGLFAVVTGVNGRPVPAIEASSESMEGPWQHVPLLYQVNDPSAPLPFCFPHFPRLDWTLWFIPNGETGVWIARLFNGITVNDPAVIGLLNEPAFHQTFPTEPPAIVRVVPRTYNLDSSRGWLVSDDSRYTRSPVLAVFKKGDIEGMLESDPLPWPSLPVLRPLASAGRPEYFVWGCLGTAEIARRATKVGGQNGVVDDNPDESGEG